MVLVLVLVLVGEGVGLPVGETTPVWLVEVVTLPVGETMPVWLVEVVTLPVGETTPVELVEVVALPVGETPPVGLVVGRAPPPGLSVGQGQPVAPVPGAEPDVTVTVVVLNMAAGQVTVTGTTVVSLDVDGVGQAGGTSLAVVTLGVREGGTLPPPVGDVWVVLGCSLVKGDVLPPVGGAGPVVVVAPPVGEVSMPPVGVPVVPPPPVGEVPP